MNAMIPENTKEIELASKQLSAQTLTSSANSEDDENTTPIGSLPQPHKKFGVLRQMPQPPEFSPHPVSLGVDYDLALAAFNYRKKMTKVSII